MKLEIWTCEYDPFVYTFPKEIGEFEPSVGHFLIREDLPDGLTQWLLVPQNLDTKYWGYGHMLHQEQSAGVEHVVRQIEGGSLFKISQVEYLGDIQVDRTKIKSKADVEEAAAKLQKDIKQLL